MSAIQQFRLSLYPKIKKQTGPQVPRLVQNDAEIILWQAHLSLSVSTRHSQMLGIQLGWSKAWLQSLWNVRAYRKKWRKRTEKHYCPVNKGKTTVGQPHCLTQHQMKFILCPFLKIHLFFLLKSHPFQCGVLFKKIFLPFPECFCIRKPSLEIYNRHASRIKAPCTSAERREVSIVIWEMGWSHVDSQMFLQCAI